MASDAVGEGPENILQIVDRDKLVKGNPQSADRFAPTLRPDHPALQDAEFRPRYVVAMHEAMVMPNVGTAAMFAFSGFRGSRTGAAKSRTLPVRPVVADAQAVADAVVAGEVARCLGRGDEVVGRNRKRAVR